MIVGEFKLESLTIATPFYNESDGLNNFFKTLIKINKLISKKIIVKYLFIDDGSSDDTLKKLSNFKKINKFLDIKIYKHKVNYGYGRTLKNSIYLCKTNYLITYDSDCTYDYKIIKKLINSIKQEVDIINVSYKLSKDKYNISFFRKILSWGASIIYKLFIKEVKKYNISVYTCSFRIYRLKKIRNIKIYSDDFNACAEIILKAILKNLIIKEIPGVNIGRKYGYSKMKVLKNIFNTLKTIFLIRLEKL